MAFHCTWFRDWDNVRGALSAIEQELAPFDARPHWGKLFTISPDRLRAIYRKLPEFRNLVQKYDPGGKFSNAFVNTYVWGED